MLGWAVKGVSDVGVSAVVVSGVAALFVRRLFVGWLLACGVVDDVGGMA